MHDNDSVLLLSNQWELRQPGRPQAANNRENTVPIAKERQSPLSGQSTIVLEMFELLCKIERVAQSLRRSWEKQLRKTIPNMSAGRAAVILQLGRSGGASQIHVARLLGFSQMTVSRLLDDLERLGWVRREPAPGDRRAWSVRLTDSGREAWLAVHAAHKSFDLQGISVIDNEQWATFVAMLARLRATQAGQRDV